MYKSDNRYKLRLKLILYTISFVAFLNISSLSPFVPPQGNRLGLNYTMISFIISSFAIWGGIFSYITGSIASKVGRKNLILIGVFLNAISVFWTAMLYWVNEVNLFAYSLVGIRFLQGTGDGLITVGQFSLLAIYWKGAEYQSAIGTIGVVVGLGISLGPVIGEFALTYFEGNYAIPMFGFGVFQVVLVVLGHFNIRNDRQLAYHSKSFVSDEAQTQLKNDFYHKKLNPSYSTILRYEYSVLCYVSCFLAIGTINLPIPELATVLLSYPYYASPLIIGLFFWILNACQVVGSLIIINTTWINKNYGLIMGEFCMATGFLVMSQFWTNDRAELKLVFMAIGLGLVGFGMDFTFVVTVPLQQDFYKSELSLEEDELNVYTDYLSGLFGISYQVGSLVVPTLGGYLTDQYGFEGMCLRYSGVLVAFGLVFMVRVCGNHRYFATRKSVLNKLMDSAQIEVKDFEF